MTKPKDKRNRIDFVGFLVFLRVMYRYELWLLRHLLVEAEG